jgi:hypothetical protein
MVTPRIPKKAKTGLSSRSVLERMSEIQMLDMIIPATMERLSLTSWRRAIRIQNPEFPPLPMAVFSNFP